MFNLRPHQHRACDAMRKNEKGTIIIPTGGGKTMCMIQDTLTTFDDNVNCTVVVVAPRILLAEQLCSEFLEHISASVLHVHSGETHHFSTTKAKQIKLWDKYVRGKKLIFTTYNSLQKIVDSEIVVNTAYFDEAHNSVKRNFFAPTEVVSQSNARTFFFTATPKYSATIFKPGMNIPEVYGQTICQVPAPELVEGGYILPPKVVVKKMEMADKGINYDRDSDYMLSTIDDNDVDKILIAARTTKQIIGLVSQTDFCVELYQRGYSWMMITSKTGAVIDGNKVDRETFFETLNEWGKTKGKRFVVIHHSILSEGINVNGLEAVLFLRNMDYIGISQTIGRVIRLGDKSKRFGLVVCPVYDNVGISTSRKVQAVVDTVFNIGEPAISTIKR
tara:strand:+ start:5210 stop:6376 length:1167 start_codon:yes stop_codon:yes gene_type:complete